MIRKYTVTRGSSIISIKNTRAEAENVILTVDAAAKSQGSDSWKIADHVWQITDKLVPSNDDADITLSRSLGTSRLWH